MRAFFAIEIPPAVGEKLMKLVPPLKQVKRGRAAALHLTMHFLVDAKDDLPERLSLAGLPAPFRLMPGRFVLLPENGPVRIISAGVAGDLIALRKLHGVIGAELGRVGEAVEARPFLPHITLARCEPELPGQVRGQTPMEPREDVSFDVASVVFFEPRRGEAGKLEHVERRRWQL